MGCVQPAPGSVEFDLVDPSGTGPVTDNMGLPTRASYAHDVSATPITRVSC